MAQEPPTPPAESDTPVDDPQLPKLKDLPIPDARTLLHEPPVDWLVLKNERVIVCRPLSPRPDTLAAMQAVIDDSRKWPKPATKEGLEEYRQKREALFQVKLMLPGDDDQPEYQLHMRYVSQIVHHEDLVLKRVDLFLDAGELRDAFEMLFVLERDHAGWPGAANRQKRLLLLEGRAAIARNDPEAGLAHLEELHARDPKFEGLKGAMGTAVDRLVVAAVAAEDFPRARHFLERLRRREPQHEVFIRRRDELLGRATALLAEARTASADRRHDIAADAVGRAAVVWPSTPGLVEAHRQFAGRFQSLRVGVVHLAGEPTVFSLKSDADRRQRRLTTAELFEVDAFDESARYRSPLLDGWEPTDLGRRVVLSLRPARSPSETVPIITARELADTLAARLDARSPRYDERLANVVSAVRAPSPFELEVRLSRAPLKFESLFRWPVDRVVGVSDADAPEAGLPASASVASSRFVVHHRDAESVSYRRVIPEPDGLRQYHVADVIERKFPSHDKAVQALLRGELSMLAGIQPWDLDRLRDDGRFFVQRTAIPATHVVQFNPQTKVLRSRELRRALGSSLHRESVLRDMVLRGAAPDLARVVSGPFPSRSTAYNREVAPIAHDPSVAAALALAAKKQRGNKPLELTMVVVPDPIAEEAAVKLIEHWKACGIDVRVATAAPEGAAPIEWDLAYRIIRMEEPAVDLWPLLALNDSPGVESLQHLPQWLANELVELDDASDWPTATAVLKRLHAHLKAEMELIPLWEVDEFVVLRKNVRGFRAQPVHPYQGIESWIQDPWFPADPP